ncbi:MAG TPA: hypothetical protein VFP71_02110 [Candidatus Angelobacter sp.]|nr:hypothetical protein [Candidatus Angelobacter sp.]
MAANTTLVRLDAQIVDEAVKLLGAKSRADAVHKALLEIIALKRFKNRQRLITDSISVHQRKSAATSFRPISARNVKLKAKAHPHGPRIHP